MKSLLIIASVVALAFAGPAHRSPIDVVAVNPVSVPDSVQPGPAVIEADNVAIGPAFIEADPVSVGPAFIDAPPPSPVEIPTGTPLVQIILNINKPDVPEWSPVQVVESAPESVDTVAPPSPIEIGQPVLPVPEIQPEPVDIGTPILPSPVVILPDDLN